MAQFGDWLNERMMQKNISLADLSRATGRSSAHLSRLISGRRFASIETFRRLAIALDCSLDDVLEAAGILDSGEELEYANRKILSLLRRLSQAQRRKILEYIELETKWGGQ